MYAMLARSMTTRFAPDRINAQTRSPNSFAVTLSIRPLGSTVDTPSDCPTRISISAILPTLKLGSARHALAEAQPVPVPAALVADLVVQRPDEMDAEPTQWPLADRAAQLRRRRTERVVRDPVVLDLRDDRAALERDAKANLVIFLVAIP